MFFRFPKDTVVVARIRYERTHDDPISVRAGDAVRLDAEKSGEADIVGWVWCTGPDGREGWTPEAWLDSRGGHWVIRRDYSALELTVDPGDRFRAHFGESGFLFVETAHGETGWVPDGAVTLAVD